MPLTTITTISGKGFFAGIANRPKPMPPKPLFKATTGLAKLITSNPMATGLVQDMNTPPAPSFDADYDSEFKSMHQQAMLSDLMANDDVIAGHNPHEVLSAYSNLVSLAPTALANKEIARSLIRKHLQTRGADMYDFDTLTKLEMNLRKLQNPEVYGSKPDEGK